MKAMALDQHEREEDGASPWALAMRGLLVVVALIIAWLVWQQVRKAEDASAGPPQVTEVALLKEPPPPPPEQDLPEPEIMEVEETPMAMDEAETEEPPLPDAAEQLGLIGDGVAGADAFGLRSRTGGVDAFQAARDAAGGGMSQRDAHRRWSEGVGDLLRDRLEEEDGVRERNYRVEVRLRFDDGGRVSDCRLTSSTGDDAIDGVIRERCRSLTLPPPPANFPQPLRLGINVRGVR